jgi:hypothetical protein
MLTIMWDPTGFAVVTALESGCPFNTGYYVSKMLTPLSEWWRERGGGDCRKLMVDAEDARPHSATVSQQFMAQNAVVVTYHPPHSPDLAPSNFHLFAHVKGLLQERRLRLGSNCSNS